MLLSQIVTGSCFAPDFSAQISRISTPKHRSSKLHRVRYWHVSTVFECPPFGRCWGQTGHCDRAKMERMTHSGHCCVRLSQFMECWRLPASVSLDAGEPDHLGPFLGFVSDQPSKLGGGRRHRHATEVGER